MNSRAIYLFKNDRTSSGREFKNVMSIFVIVVFVSSLASSLLFNINPLYVLLSLLTWASWTHNKKPKKHITKTASTHNIYKHIESKTKMCVPILFETSFIKLIHDEEYDHVLIGNDIGYSCNINMRHIHKCKFPCITKYYLHVYIMPGTLYCAALLSKVGHKCCVLQPKGLMPLQVGKHCLTKWNFIILLL
jgi:hypothetical protein